MSDEPEKLDLKKKYKALYQSSDKVVTEIIVPEFNYLMIDGKGDPNTAPEYARAVEALFSLAYGLKFKIKKAKLGPDFAVMPLEGLWWAEDMSAFTAGVKADWSWTMMILQPDCVTAALVAETAAEFTDKKPLPALDNVRFAPFAEGSAAQILHVGPFSTEGPTIARLHQFIADRGHGLRGKHHEIYLSDIRKADPANWKTIIRQPMQ